MQDAHRASPSDAMLRLAQWLNLHAQSTVSINELARTTGLAWATVRKYVDVLERLQFVLPVLRLTDEGVNVGHRGLALEEALQNPVARNVFALWMLQQFHDLGQGLPTTRLGIEGELEDLESLGFVERTKKGCRLTDAGYSLANSIYADHLAFSQDRREEPVQERGRADAQERDPPAGRPARRMKRSD